MWFLINATLRVFSCGAEWHGQGSTGEPPGSWETDKDGKLINEGWVQQTNVAQLQPAGLTHLWPQICGQSHVCDCLWLWHHVQALSIVASTITLLYTPRWHRGGNTQDFFPSPSTITLQRQKKVYQVTSIAEVEMDAYEEWNLWLEHNVGMA